MNYYNPYLNYPYTNTGINQFNSPMSTAASQMQMGNQQIIPPQPQPQTLGLNGKIVDSEDVVKATEVPIGGYGIFPKADLSEIYVKTWNNNGTTSVITFQPIATPQKTETNNINNSFLSQLFQKIEIVENKIDAVLSESQKKSPSPKIEEGKSKKEVVIKAMPEEKVMLKTKITAMLEKMR